MKIEFNIDKVTTTEFGVGLDFDDADGGQKFYAIPADQEVQLSLREVAKQTKKNLEVLGDSTLYEAGEKHSSTEHLHLPVDDDLAGKLKELFEAKNLPIDTKALAKHDEIFCYFARFHDQNGRVLLAIRRAMQFKGILKNRLIFLQPVNDTITMVKDDVFKLDSDFDLLVDKDHVHIYRPAAFEFICHLQHAILKAVPDNVKQIAKELKFVDFTGIQEYAVEHTRAARYLSSIRSQEEMIDVDKAALKRQCAKNGVDVKEVKGKITVPKSHILGFLEVLDRRRYEVELVKGQTERFVAHSRSKVT